MLWEVKYRHVQNACSFMKRLDEFSFIWSDMKDDIGRDSVLNIFLR